MEIRKDNEGKWIYPAYGMYLTQKSATKDEDRVVVKSVYVPNDQSNDEWEEIDSEDVERINKAKRAAKGEVVYPEMEVNQMLGLMSKNINTMELTEEERLQYVNIHPKWENYIGKELTAKFYLQHQKKLYKTRQEIATVLDQQGYRPGEVGSEALYEEINDPSLGGHEGTKEDPIPYSNNMELFEGKYYSQNGVTYKCTRNTEQAVYQDLSALVGIYVEKAEE